MIYLLRLPFALVAGVLVLGIGAVLLGVCILETVWVTLTTGRVPRRWETVRRP